jgi:hypothetical protein
LFSKPRPKSTPSVIQWRGSFVRSNRANTSSTAAHTRASYAFIDTIEAIASKTGARPTVNAASACPYRRAPISRARSPAQTTVAACASAGGSRSATIESPAISRVSAVMTAMSGG